MKDHPIRKGLAFLVVWILIAGFRPDFVIAQFREPVRGRHAIVVSQHELASQIGIDVLKRGGNAVDAAIAVGLALAVVYPEAGNLGGGGFMLIRLPNGETHSIDYRETAPKAAIHDMYLDKKGNLVTGEGSSLVGYKASGVPGTLAGFDLAYKKYGSGRVKWRDIVEPARALAAKGYSLSYRVTELLKSYKSTLALYDDSKRIFLKNGTMYEEGDILRQPDLAKTLTRIGTAGASEFYTGRTAQLIASDMKAHGGLITLDDLRDYHAKERTPLYGTYRGYGVVVIPPPSSGGVVTLETLNILEGFDLGEMKYNAAARYHLIAEAMRRAFADRAEFLGDPDFASIPVDTLISKKYAAQRGHSIDLTHVSDSGEIGHGDVMGGESMETTNFAIVDADGTAVVNTYTINDLFGSRVTAKGTGVLMNDEMDDFASRPGQPNMFGLIQSDRNSIAAGKRPLSSMSPTMVFRKDGSFWFGVGARGGPRIISAVIQTISNVIDHDMGIQAAIDAPRIHHQWLPDVLLVEPYGMSPDTISVLRSFGHKFADKPDKVASATGVMIDMNGVRLGAADSRGDGWAVGY